MVDYSLEYIDDCEECPCGSQETYGRCCKNKKDQDYDLEELLKNNYRLNYEVLSVLKESKISTCFHPASKECSKDIVTAHSLQNKGVLSLLAEDNHVIVIKPGVDKYGIRADIMSEGKNRANTFKGFCGYHDRELFKCIELQEYHPESTKQNFIFAYRSFAYEYYKKIVALKSFQKIVKKLPSSLKYSDIVTYYRALQLSMNDFKEHKQILDSALINEEYDRINSYVVKFDYQLSIATSCAFSLLFDLEGNEINLEDMFNLNVERLKTNFLTILPQKNQSYLIYSWLSEDDDYFRKLKEQLESYNLNGIKKIFNNLVPEYTESLVFAPRLWNRFSDYMKSEIIQRIQGEYLDLGDFSLLTGNPLQSIYGKKDMHNRASYNLFRKFD